MSNTNEIKAIKLYPIKVTLDGSEVEFNDDLSFLDYLTKKTKHLRVVRDQIDEVIANNNDYQHWVKQFKENDITNRYKTEAKNVKPEELFSYFNQINTFLPKGQVLYHFGRLDNQERDYLSTTLNIGYAALMAFYDKVAIKIIIINSDDIKFHCYNDIHADMPECEVLIEYDLNRVSEPTNKSPSKLCIYSFDGFIKQQINERLY